MPKQELLFRQLMEYLRSISSIPMAFTCKSRPKMGAEPGMVIASGEIRGTPRELDLWGIREIQLVQYRSSVIGGARLFNP